MVDPTSSTIDKLALAKEMYFVGVIHGKKNTRVNRMQAILNFDFSIATVIITACGDNGLEVKQNNGKSKKWDGLIELLKEIYTNSSMIQNLDNLHGLRNLIQHGGNVPSEYDIIIHQKTVMNFFNEICSTVYEEKITFDTISLAKILKSSHESKILLFAEKYYQEENYDFARHLINIAIVYHYNLFRKNLSINTQKPFSLSFTNDISRDARSMFNELYDSLSVTIDKLSMGEFYPRFDKLLENYTESNYFGKSFSINNLKFPKNTTHEQIEDAFTEVYNIILGTEHLLSEKTDLEDPIVYGFHVNSTTANSVVLEYGILNGSKCENCNLYFIRTSSDDPDSIPENMEIDKTDGIHQIVVRNLNSNQKYSCEITSNYSDLDPDFGFPRPRNYVSRLSFQI